MRGDGTIQYREGARKEKSGVWGAGGRRRRRARGEGRGQAFEVGGILGIDDLLQEWDVPTRRGGRG